MRGHFEDMTGRRFGRLVILEELRHNRVKCQCDCGNVVIIGKTRVVGGYTQSCGCLNRDRSAENLRSLTQDGGRMFKSRLKSEKPQSNNTTSGVKGVWFDKSRGLWAAEIKIRGEKHFLGRFYTLEDARKARKDGEEKYFKPVIEEGEEKMTEQERLAHNAKMRKYQRTLGQISIRLPKEELAKYKSAAEAAGMTFRAWILTALDKMISLQ